MNPIKSTATVEVNGQIHVVGLPFAPGTEVDVTISPKLPSPTECNDLDESALTAARERMRELFAALDKGRNTEPVGPLRREELYDRKVLH